MRGKIAEIPHSNAPPNKNNSPVWGSGVSRFNRKAHRPEGIQPGPIYPAFQIYRTGYRSNRERSSRQARVQILPQRIGSQSYLDVRPLVA